jgi:dienelactone hydrolase
MDGIQCWVALPRENEESAPAFAHHAAAELPTVEDNGARARVIAGEAFGCRAPVRTDSPLFYVHCELAAGAPFYGAAPNVADVPKINAALMLHFAEMDAGINGRWPAYEEALKANSKTYQAFTYPGTGHGFHNDTGARYDEAAAKLAQERTIAFFRENLK